MFFFINVAPGQLQGGTHQDGKKFESPNDHCNNSSGSYGRSRRRWGLLSPSGGSRWVAPVSTRRASFSALKPILQRAKSNRRSTWSGTKFPRHNREDLNASLKKGYSKKQLGIGASAGFIGGSTHGYGSGLASYSVYHRQGNL